MTDSDLMTDFTASLERRLRAAAHRLPAASRPPLWRRTSVRLATAAVVTAAALVVVLAGAPSDVHPPGGADPAHAARACLRQPTPRPGPADGCLLALAPVAARQADAGGDEIRYQRNLFTSTMRGWGGALRHIGADHRFPAAAEGRYAFSLVINEEIWVTPAGEVRIEYPATGRWVPSSSYDERTWRDAGAPPVTASLPDKLGFGPPVNEGSLRDIYLGNSGFNIVLPKDGDPLRVVPRERTELEAWLRRAAWRQRASRVPECQPDGSGCTPELRRVIDDTFGSNITTLLRYPDTPASLRATLLQIFAELPGAKLAGEVVDPAGRTVAVIQLPPGVNDGRPMIAFDPASSRMTGEGMAIDGAPGAVRWHYIYAVASGPVAEVGARP